MLSICSLRPGGLRSPVVAGDVDASGRGRWLEIAAACHAAGLLYRRVHFAEVKHHAPDEVADLVRSRSLQHGEQLNHRPSWRVKLELSLTRRAEQTLIRGHALRVHDTEQLAIRRRRHELTHGVVLDPSAQRRLVRSQRRVVPERFELDEAGHVLERREPDRDANREPDCMQRVVERCHDVEGALRAVSTRHFWVSRGLDMRLWHSECRRCSEGEREQGDEMHEVRNSFGAPQVGQGHLRSEESSSTAREGASRGPPRSFWAGCMR